jgi:O-antigen ligase
LALAGLLALAGVLAVYAVMGAAAGTDSTVKALVVVTAPAFLVVALLRPDVAALAMPALVFSNSAFVLNDQFGLPNVVHLTSVLLVGSFLLQRRFRERLLVWTPPLVAGLVFVAVRIVSAVQTPGVDVRAVAEPYVFSLLMVLAVTVLCSTRWGLRGAAFVLVATAAVIATATMLRRSGIGGTWMGYAGDIPLTPELQLIANRSLNLAQDQTRVAGPVTDPNFWAQYLVLALPLALWAIGRRSGWPSRTLAIAAAVAILAGIGATESRGGAIAALIAVGIWMWLQGGRHRKAILILPVVGVLAISTSGAAERFQELRGITNVEEAADSSISGRLSENLAAWQMWRDHPVLGVGADQYPPNYRRYAARIGLDDRAVRNAHNSYLQMAAEAGTLGLAAFAGLMLVTLGSARRARHRLAAARWHVEARLADALFAGLVGFAVAAIFLHQAWPDYLWLACAMIAGAWLLGWTAQESMDEPADEGSVRA